MEENSFESQCPWNGTGKPAISQPIIPSEDKIEGEKKEEENVKSFKMEEIVDDILRNENPNSSNSVANNDVTSSYRPLYTRVFIPAINLNQLRVSRTNRLAAKRRNERNAELPSSVTKLTSPVTGAEVYIIGTSHFSKGSKEDVKQAIRLLRPNIVVVELCQNRFSVSQFLEEDDEETEEDENVTQVDKTDKEEKERKEAFKEEIKELLIDESKQLEKESQIKESGKKENEEKQIRNVKSRKIEYGASLNFLHYLIGSFYGNVISQLNVEKSEFEIAFSEALKHNCEYFVLGDRPFEITLQRAWHFLSFYDKLSFIFESISGLSMNISSADLDKMKNSDLLEEMLEDFAESCPSLASTLVHERDQYLTATIRECRGPIVVAVVGGGHVQGIKKHWNEKAINLAALLEIPRSPSWHSKGLVFIMIFLPIFTLLFTYFFLTYLPISKPLFFFIFLSLLYLQLYVFVPDSSDILNYFEEKRKNKNIKQEDSH